MSKNGRVKNKMTLEEFIEKQNKINEQQMIINNNMNLQNKKNKKGNLFMVFVCLFVSGISSVLSYTLGASSVEYTPRDSNWKVENTQEAIDDLFNSVGSSLVGSVYSYMGTSAPFGYLACDGSTYNIEDYPRLANHINRSFGSYNYFGGDGTTTFAVPDLRGEFLRGTGKTGGTVGTHQGDGLPNITGTLVDVESYSVSGAFTRSVGSVHVGTGNGTAVFGTISFSAANSNSIYGAATEVRPKNTSVLYIIKY